MKGKVGDKVVVESERVAQPARTGVIEEILDENAPRLLVRWDDGRTSILVPSSGSVRIEAARGGAKKRSTRSSARR